MTSEIEISPRTIAEAPRQVLAENAVRSLRQVTEETERFAAEVAERQSLLNAAREEAIAIQEEFQSMIEERHGILDQIKAAEAELAVCGPRLAELEAYFRQHFLTRPQHEQIGEFQRREFMAARVPRYIADWRATLAALDARIHKFATEHGIEKPL